MWAKGLGSVCSPRAPRNRQAGPRAPWNKLLRLFCTPPSLFHLWALLSSAAALVNILLLVSSSARII